MAAHLLVYALPLRDINDNVVVGGTIEFFEPGGSSTPKAVWSNYTLTTGAGTTVDTDAYGMPEKSSTSIEVYGDGDYYVIYKDSGGNIIRDYEWLEEIALPVSAEEWQTSNLTPTYISATTFSVPGDQTEVLDVGRILKIQLSSSIIYRRIEVSAYTTVTTITVATGLTSPITSFEYSFLNGTNQSVPDPIKSDLGDENSFSVVKTATTTSATSGIIVTPAATGNNPSIDVDGEDVGLDIEGVTLKNGSIVDASGNEIITPSSVASAVNELTVTNSATGNDPSIKPTGTDTDINIEIDGKGTGRLTTKATPVYGLVILDTPEQLLSTGTPATSATAINSTTLNTALAKKAIIRVYVAPSATAASIQIGNSSGIGLSHRANYSEGSGIGVSEITTNLDSNYDFFYYSSTGTVNTLELRLVGYYV